ncbi:MAG: hypothetical protein ABI658_12875 [Acidimicrobiales bacterium]
MQGEPWRHPSVLLDKREANELAVEIAHHSGILADVWEVQPRRDGVSNPRRYYLVLRDANHTEVVSRDGWNRYVNDQRLALDRPVRPSANN